ncbi:MAG: discoidin domain-containing protein, partial [bacterium]
MLLEWFFSRASALGTALTLVFLTSSLFALNATLSVNAASGVNTFVPVQAFGVNAAQNNFLADVKAVQPQLQAAGITVIRYPGGSGSDHYHWNGTGTWNGNVWVPSNTNFSSGFTCNPLNNGTSAAGISDLTDGLTTTAWISNSDTDAPDAQWAYVDLGGVKTTNQIRIWWDNPYATTFQLQYWNTSGSWSPYQSTANSWVNIGSYTGTSGEQTVNFGAVSTEFVRILLTSSSSPQGYYAVDQVELFNGATQLTTNTDASGQSPATVSSCTVTSASTGPSEMDFNQFMTYCNSFGPVATPIITVNFGTGTPQEAAAWVYYANVVKGYHVKYWEIGNEIFGNWEAGGPLSATDYGRRFMEYYTAMTAVDPTIKLLGPVCGPTSPSNDLNGDSFIQDFVQRLLSGSAGADLGGLDVHDYADSDDTDADLLATPPVWTSNAATMNSGLTGLADAATLPVFLTEYNANASGTNITVRLADGLWMVNWLGQYLKNFGSRAWATFFALINSGGDES